MEKLGNGTEITYLGHSAFKIKSPGGKIILIDPWIEGNPVYPESEREFDRIDILAVTHMHFDHLGQSVEIAREHQPIVVGIAEFCKWIASKGARNTAAMNKGGTRSVEGIKFSMVNAFHSSTYTDEDGSLVNGGEPAGFVIEFESGFKIYHAGDTCIFGDMELIGRIYGPELAMLPIGDVFTMSPMEASHACRLLKPKYAIPMHYGTFPVLTGTPGEFKELTRDIEGLEVLELKPGETLK